MHWENLKDLRCPHCSEKLQKEMIDDVVRCTVCTFSIEEKRFSAIKAHRSNPERATVKLKWQNIREDKCPMCGDSIRPTLLGHLAILRCSSSVCTFIIRESTLEEILANENHPVNTFYKQHKENYGN